MGNEIDRGREVVWKPASLGTEEVGRRLGMSSEWVRRQVLAGRLRAVVYRTTPGSRSIYRIRADWIRAFQARFTIEPGSDE